MAKSIDILKNTFSQYTVYLVNYRGYGGSTGTPTQKNLFYDARFIYKEVIKRHKNISVIGRSLGTGIAAYLASNEKVSKLILTTPYDSIINMAKDKYPFYPLDSIMKDPYNTDKLAKDINIPILIVLASKDETINEKYSDNLIKAFKENNLKVITIEDSGHGSIIDSNNYYKSRVIYLYSYDSLKYSKIFKSIQYIGFIIEPVINPK
ncbi:MAG: alpha/beta fold hydrolase [Campylobacteraceae bacterium]|nr:alpha/beta fold hydrolase [Campylobacteraceae bacterium]